MNTAFNITSRPNWQARAVVSGFAASGVMLFAFIIAFLVAALLAGLDLARWPAGATLQSWLYNLTHNPVISLAAVNLYAAAAIFLAGGLFWAYVYAAAVEPNLTGGPAWRQGALYALAPALLTLVIVLPLVGGGVAGADLGAGPLPALGIVLLHLIYGTVLGALYGPLGDADDESPAGLRPLPSALLHSERTMALGVIGGAFVGFLVGLLLVAARPIGTSLHPAGLVLGSALLASALGLLIGSFAGLQPGADDQSTRR